jgi:perosamine synthetase
VTRERIAVAHPVLQGNESAYVQECLETTWISSAGRFIGEFEKGFASFCDVPHAVATNNGTTALHLTLVALGVGPGDEVVIPTLTYIATANAVRYCGATPVLADADPRTLNLDPAAVERALTPRTRAIIPVHLYGHPVDMDPLLELARSKGIAIIEDAAEAHGARYKGRRAGSLGDCATFSFFGNKIITTGEGGMVTTADAELEARLRLYRGQGMDPQRRYWFPVVGYNYRMTNVAAAIGLAQLERVDHLLAARRQVASWYIECLSDAGDDVVLPVEEPYAHHVYWIYNVLLQAGVDRDEVMRRLDADGIETRPTFFPMHVLPPYAEDPARFPVADDTARRGVNLPTHGLLTAEDVAYVAERLLLHVRALRA